MRYFINDSEFPSLAAAKKEAVKIAAQTKDEVYITGLSASYKHNWYTVLPDGTFIVDGKNMSFNN